MPPPFRPTLRFRLPARSRSGARRGRLWLVGLLAIATGTLLIWTSKRPLEAEPTLVPAAAPSRSKGIKALFSRSDRQRQPLTVPPPVLPQPLPPQQAWPDLPLMQAQPSFTDLDSSHWAWPILADLAQRKLIAGFPDGTFRPADPVTRAEFAAQLARLFNLPPDLSRPPGDTTYSDISASHWAYGSIQQSVRMGFLSGYPDDSFLPDQTLSRIHVIVALANGLMLRSSSSAALVLAPYSDYDQVPPWAIRSLVAAMEAGLVVNHPDVQQLAPNRPASRSEVAAMLHRALVYAGYLQNVPSPYVAGSPTQQAP